MNKDKSRSIEFIDFSFLECMESLMIAFQTSI